MGTRTRNFANNILTGGKIDGTDFLSGAVAAPNIANSSAVNVSSIPSISNVISPVAGDPPSPAIGDIWYNSSAKRLRYQSKEAFSWSTGGALPTATSAAGAAGTSNTAALIFGGFNPPGAGITTSLSYNGTSWTSATSMNIARIYHGSAGTETSSLAAGGNDPPVTTSEEYDGSAWTSGGTMNTGRRHLDGYGTLSAAWMAGGWTGTAQIGNTEEYDGTNWTNGGSLNQTRYGISSGGSLTAGLAAGGGTPGSPPAYNNVEEYNGTSWTAVTGMPGGRSYGTGWGPQTNFIQVSGYDGSGNSTTTFNYDGSTWTSGSSISVARNDLVGAGTNGDTAGVIMGGAEPGGNSTSTEEYSAPEVIKNFAND